MDKFARRPDADRLAFINEAAARHDLAPIIIEKDFWVCWTLRRLVQSPALRGHFTFKGGTSLSKAYGIIERFSEDIDLTVGRDAPLIRDTAPPMEEGISGKERDRRTKALKTAAQTYIETHALPQITTAIAEALGTNDGWQVILDPEDNDHQTILFQYPKLLSYGEVFAVGGANTAPANTFTAGGPTFREREGYIRPRIKLEFGARGETEPSELKPITPYLAEIFADELPDAVTQVPTLSVLRTFWEKVTILHALHHGTKLLPAMSRHYYDTVMLAAKGIDDAALTESNLLEKVVRNKSLMFADKRASYDTAILGTLRLVPDAELRAKIETDYQAMTEMFMAPPPTFAEMMMMLAKLEAKLNKV